MATTRQQLAKKINRVYTDVYLKRRLNDSSYEADWTDISRYCIRDGLNTLVYALDSGDFDVGVFTLNNIEMTFDNRDGRFNEPYDSRSYWAAFESRHQSKIKIEAGYLDDDGTKIQEIVFQGLIDDRAVVIDSDDQVSFTVLSRESAFASVSVPAGALSSSIAASDAFLVLCTRPEITAHMTVSSANIRPAVDVTIDDPSLFDGKKLDTVLDELLFLTNSVMLIDINDNLVVKPRTHSKRVKYAFRLNSETGYADNIYGFANFNSGRQRVKNLWVWGGTSLSASSATHHRQRWGVTKKSVSSECITNPVTMQQILDALRDEWQFPKREISITTDYLANEINLLDTVTVDIRPSIKPRENFPICGDAVAGEAICAVYTSGTLVSPALGFKVISIEHDLKGFKTTLKLREKGKQLTDGYFHMVLSKSFTVVFTAETTKDIDVEAEGMDARRCMVEILDSDDSFRTNMIDITRPSTSVIRLTAGSAITANLQVLVIEVEE